MPRENNAKQCRKKAGEEEEEEEAERETTIRPTDSGSDGITTGAEFKLHHSAFAVAAAASAAATLPLFSSADEVQSGRVSADDSAQQATKQSVHPLTLAAAMFRCLCCLLCITRKRLSERERLPARR